ncbi:DUF5671 domain-containing protein [Humibacillus xanthopallidus]|uniref:DUF5671 domain-containing protein n=1 Tax=Humibacillus xanthopallidus TaxID=412689 RepID=UPI00384BB6F0
MIVISLLVTIAVVVAVVLAGRKGASQARGAPPDAHAVRRFFQYLVLYGLLVVAAIGLSGLLGRLIGAEPVVEDESGLALSLAFTVVGLPLYAALAWWSGRSLRADPAEAESGAWAAYVTLASLTSLAVAMDSLSASVRGLLGVVPDGAAALASLVVWGGAWAAHWWVHLRLVTAGQSRLHHLGGSLLGLGTAATGLIALAGAAGQRLLGMGTEIVPPLADQMVTGAVGLGVGALVWWLYWLRTASRSARDPLWLGYVLLVGGAGLVTAVVSASTVLYTLLVWLVGEPEISDAARHFIDTPLAAAAALVGVVVWFYHQRVLADAGVTARTEVRRVYEYLMAAIGLLAAAAGLTMLVVAGIEAVVGPETAVLGVSAVNTLLLAGTLLVVGSPVWWSFWSRIRRAAAAEPAVELASPARRIYLLVLFGVGAMAAVVALLVGVYVFFEDLVTGTVGPETLREMRVPIGILLSTGAIAGYHGAVYRAGRRMLPRAAHSPDYVLLVGPPDPEIAHAVAHETGGRVQAWTAEDGGSPWTVDEVMAALGASPAADEVLVLSDASGVHAIPVHRA